MTTCCGKPTIQKDHKTWIGWFCTVCKSGGSVPKKRRFKGRHASWDSYSHRHPNDDHEDFVSDHQ